MIITINTSSGLEMWKWTRLTANQTTKRSRGDPLVYQQGASSDVGHPGLTTRPKQPEVSPQQHILHPTRHQATCSKSRQKQQVRCPTERVPNKAYLFQEEERRIFFTPHSHFWPSIAKRGAGSLVV